MALNAPSNINLTSTELGKVNITFDMITLTPYYKIERSESLNNGFSTLTNNLTITTYADTGLDDGKLYFYKISASSDGVTFGTPTKLGIVTKLPNPSNVTAVLDKFNGVKVTFDASGTKYDIEESSDGGTIWKYLSTDATIKKYNKNGLEDGKTYKYRVKGKEKEISFTFDKTTTVTDEVLKMTMTTSDMNNTNKWSWANKNNLTLQYKGQQAKMFSYGDWLFYGWPWARNTSGTLHDYRDSSLSGWKLSGSNYSSRSSYSAGSENGAALYIPTIKWEDKLVSYGGIIDINSGLATQHFTDEIYILDIGKCVNESTTNHNGFSNVKIVGSSGQAGDKSYKLTQLESGTALDTAAGVNIVDNGGNKYVFNDGTSYDSALKYLLTNGTYTIQNIPTSHPIAILNVGKTSAITYTGDVDKKYSKTVSGTTSDGTYDFYYGNVTITVSDDFDKVSVYCYYHDYMGGKNLFEYGNVGRKPKVGTNVVKRSAYGAAVLGNTMWVIGGYSLGDNSFTQSRIDRKNIGSTASLADSDKDHREVYDKINQINLSTGVWGTEYNIIDTAAGGAGSSLVKRQFINRAKNDGTGTTTATTSGTDGTNNTHTNADKLTNALDMVIHNDKIYWTKGKNIYRSDLTLNSNIEDLGTNHGDKNHKHMLLVGDNIYTQSWVSQGTFIYKYDINADAHSTLYTGSTGNGYGFGMALDRTGDYIYTAFQEGSYGDKDIEIYKIKLSDGTKDTVFNKIAISQDAQDGRGLSRVGNYLYLAVQAQRVIIKIDIANKSSEIWVGKSGDSGDTNGTGTNATLKMPRASCVGPNNTYLYLLENHSNSIRIKKIEISSATVTEYYLSTNDYAGHSSASPLGMLQNGKYIYVCGAYDIRRLDSYIESNVTNLKYSNVVAVNNSTYNNQLFVFGGEGRGEDKLWRVDTTVNPPTWNDITNMVECPQTFDFYVTDTKQGWPHAIADSKGILPSKYGYSFAELWNDKWIIFVHQANNINYGGVYALDVSRDPPYLYKLTSTQSNSQNSMSQPYFAVGNSVTEGNAHGWERSSNPITGCIHKGMLHLSVGQYSDKIFSIDIETTLREAIWAEIKDATSYTLRRSNDNFVGNDYSIGLSATDISNLKKTLTTSTGADGQTYKITTTVPGSVLESGTTESNSVIGPLYTQDVSNVTLSKSGNDITIDFGTVTGGTVSEYKIERSYDDVTWTQIATQANNTQVTDTVTTSATGLYYYRISAKNSENNLYSDASSNEFVIEDDSSAPTGITVSGSNNKAKVEWTGQGSITKYKVEYRDVTDPNSPGDWQTFEDNVTDNVANKSTGIDNGKTYEFKVKGKEKGISMDLTGVEYPDITDVANNGPSRPFAVAKWTKPLWNEEKFGSPYSNNGIQFTGSGDSSNIITKGIMFAFDNNSYIVTGGRKRNGLYGTKSDADGLVKTILRMSSVTGTYVNNNHSRLIYTGTNPNSPQETIDHQFGDELQLVNTSQGLLVVGCNYGSALWYESANGGQRYRNTYDIGNIMKVNFSSNYQYQKLTRTNNDVTSIVYNSNITKEWIGQTAVSFGTSSNYLYVLGGSYRWNDGKTKTHPYSPTFSTKQNTSLRRIRLKTNSTSYYSYSDGGVGTLNGKMMYVTMVAIDGTAVGASYEKRLYAFGGESGVKETIKYCDINSDETSVGGWNNVNLDPDGESWPTDWHLTQRVPAGAYNGWIIFFKPGYSNDKNRGVFGLDTTVNPQKLYRFNIEEDDFKCGKINGDPVTATESDKLLAYTNSPRYNWDGEHIGCICGKQLLVRETRPCSESDSNTFLYKFDLGAIVKYEWPRTNNIKASSSSGARNTFYNLQKSSDGVTFESEKTAELLNDNFFITPKLTTMPTYKIVTVKDGETGFSNTASKAILEDFFTGFESAEIVDSEKNKIKITFAEEVEASGVNENDFAVQLGGFTQTITNVAIDDSNKKELTLTLGINITDAAGVIKFKYTRHSSTDNRRLQYISNLKQLATFANNFEDGLVTNKILPGAVAGLSVTFLNKRANLSWTATAGAEHYIIEQKKDNGNWVQIATNIKITKFTASRLKNNADYQFRVFAGKPGGLKNTSNPTASTSEKPTADKGFNRIFANLGSGAGSKKEKVDKLVNFTEKVRVFSTANIKAGTGRVKKGAIPADIITAQKELITSATTDSDKRKVRNEVIKLLFSAAEDAAEADQTVPDISSIVLTKDDLAITTSAIKKTDLVVILPAKERTVVTLNLEDYDNDPDLQDKGFYIPIENGEAALLSFKEDKRVFFDRQDDETNSNDIKEKIFITQPQGTSTFTKISRTTFDIDSTTENYLLPDDVITINGIEIVIGSLGDGRAALGKGPAPVPPPDKTQPGIFTQPESVLNNYHSSGGFGGSLSNKKLGSLVDGVGKKKTSYTDYALGSKPTAPYKNWSQPVRNKKLGSMGRLARLKANAIKNSR